MGKSLLRVATSDYVPSASSCDNYMRPFHVLELIRGYSPALILFIGWLKMLLSDFSSTAVIWIVM